ncbi:MAG: nucleotidyltransferase family protein [Pararhodobacter sp.]|nr:nucleotidyltransferase family protein [Pararhodobacter sp.]
MPVALAVLIPAAGASRRMHGRDKLLEGVAGEPVLRRLAREALDAALGPVAVTLRWPDPVRRAALDGLAVSVLELPEAGEGMAASLRAGAAWALGQGVAGLFICPADMPAIEAGDFAALAAEFSPGGKPLRAASPDGRAGHPVLFPATLLERLENLQGDAGAGAVLAAFPPRLVPLRDARALIDLDTQEDWENWRKGAPPFGPSRP